MNLNKVMFAGHLTRDPELKKTTSGLSICEFGLAASRKNKAKSGEIREEVCFVEVTVFGKTADAVLKYVSKGSNIYIDGRLVLDQWQDRNDGNNRSKLKIVAESVQFISNSKSESSENNNYTPPQQQQRRGNYTAADHPQTPQQPGLEDPDEDVPPF